LNFLQSPLSKVNRSWLVSKRLELVTEVTGSIYLEIIIRDN